MAAPPLSQADLGFWRTNGYVVARGVISKEQAARTAERVWTYANMDSQNPETWYGDKRGIMIEMYQARRSPLARLPPIFSPLCAAALVLCWNKSLRRRRKSSGTIARRPVSTRPFRRFGALLTSSSATTGPA